jgi:hypothetical protein
LVGFLAVKHPAQINLREALKPTRHGRQAQPLKPLKKRKNQQIREAKPSSNGNHL